MSVAANPPTIFLVNQISGHGHLDMYARLYSTAFFNIGYDVVLITQSKDGLAALTAKADGRFTCFTRDELRALEERARIGGAVAETPAQQGPESTVQKLKRIWREEGIGGVAKRLGVIVLYKFLTLAYYLRVLWAGLIDTVLVHTPLKKLFAAGHMSFADLTQEIALAERFGCKKASLVYFLYLDMISDRRKSCRALAAMPAPWSGLLFHPRAKGNSAALERYFHCANNRGCTFLNPDQTEAYRALMPGRTFVSLPDVTEMEIEPDFELAATIKARAGGRKIVLMIGSLSPHKGVMNFLEVVRLADAQRYFFALIGEVFWAQYGDDEPKLRAFVATPPSNCFVRTEYIEGDRGVNAVIAASDIMFAVYKDFPNSSNSLNKASIFEKPILVSAGNLMARRVNEDRMGESVPFGDPQAALAALDRLGARNKADFGFAKYRDAHSLEALQRQLAVMADGSLGRSESMAAE